MALQVHEATRPTLLGAAGLETALSNCSLEYSGAAVEV
jgi:hypothetical protein